MKKYKNNFAHVIDWLRTNGFIHNQKDLAERIGTTETTITRNKKGNVRHFDEETLCKFNEVFGTLINIAYMRGESDIMLVSDLPKQNRVNTDINSYNCNHSISCQKPTSPYINSWVNSLLAAKDEIITILRNQLTDKDALIESKERYIEILQQQISDLRNTEGSQDDFSLASSVTAEIHK